ncbi:MAG: acyltransferase family protein [Vulcanimicrobiota bacterium]
MRYRADIDGLRAIAVIAVIMYHAHLGFPGGYVGVDVFFVISGFLITSILLKKLKNGTFSYLDFWERRVRRLVPALFVVTVFTALASYLILLPADLVDLGGALIAQPLLMANVYFWRVVQGGYFGDPPEIRPLLHTWSLGVEEQFYVFFPLLLMLCWAHPFFRARLGKVLVAIAVVSFALGVFLTPIKGVAAFFNLPTRAWELLMGGLLVFAPAIPKRFRESFSWLGVGLIFYAVFFFHKETPFPGTAALVPCLGSALLIWSNEAGGLTRAGRLLAHPVMVKIGLASYSLYLWHWPLMAFGDYTGLMYSVEAKVFVVILSFWAGFLSWNYVETPFRGHTWLKTRRGVFILFLAYVGVCGSIGVWYRVNDGFPGNWDPGSLQLIESTGERNFVYEHEPGRPDLALRSIGAQGTGNVDFLLWGDSHAMSLAAALDSLGIERGMCGVQLTAAGSKNPLGFYKEATISPNNRRQRDTWTREIVSVVDRVAPRAVVICGYWQSYRVPELHRDLAETVEDLTQRGVVAYIMLDNPRVRWGLFRTEALRRRWAVIDSESKQAILVPLQEHLRENASFAQFAATLGCRVLDPAPIIYKWDGLVDGGKALYYDDDHLSDHGALRLRGLLGPVFEELSRRRDGEVRGDAD